MTRTSTYKCGTEEDFDECVSYEEIIYNMISRSGLSIKFVAGELWKDEESIERAQSKLRDALNPTRLQKLDLDEIIEISNICNRDDILKYFAQKTGYKVEKREVKKELREMLEEYKELYRQSTRNYQRFLRLFELWEEKDRREKFLKE